MTVNERHWAMRLPSDLYDQLSERAQQEERTPAGVMRLLARLYVESEPGAPLLPVGGHSSDTGSSAA